MRFKKGDFSLNNIRPKRITDLWLQDKNSGKVKVISDVKLSLDEYQLDEVGGFIWKLSDGNHSVEEIIQELISKCENNIKTPNQISQDVVTFIEDLKGKGLINWDSNETVDILLVMPTVPSPYALNVIKTPEYSAPPLGLCYIAAVLKNNGFKVAIFDMHQGAHLPENIINECRNKKPKIIGITATSPTYPNATRIAKFIKAYDNKIITVLGGAHATCAPIECVKSGAFDYVCVGEGEQSFLELTAALLNSGIAPSNIPGFYYLDSNKTVINSGARDRLLDLDTLPYPARDLIKLGDYYQKGSVISSRGCPFNCNYCACAAISGKTYRCHSVDYVLNEIECLIDKYDCSFIDFHDDIFNFSSKRVFDICASILARGMKFTWGCFCRASHFSQEMAISMKNAGCKVIQFGVESGSQEILDSIKKNTTLEQIENAVKAAASAGIQQVVCGFIIGHANDTEKTIRETIQFGLRLSKIGATRLTLSLLTPYPGTEVYDNMKKLGITLLTNDLEEFIFSRVVIETEYLKKEKLRELYSEGIIEFLKATKQ